MLGEPGIIRICEEEEMMGWRTAAALAIVALIVGVGTAALAKAMSVCDEILSCIDDELSSVKQLDKPSGSLRDAKELWNSCRLLFSASMTHERTNAVDQGFERAEAFSEAYNREEYFSALMELRFNIVMVRNFDKPDLRNIF